MIYKDKLSEFADVFNGKTPSTAEKRNSGKPVLKIKDIDQENHFIGVFDSFVDEEFFIRHYQKSIKKNDILILNAAHNADYVGNKMYVAEDSVIGALATGEWMIVRPKSEKIDPKLIRLWLQYPKTRFELKKLVKGIHLYPNDVANTLFSVGLEDSNGNILEIIDKISSLIKRRKETIKLADEFLRSKFLEMFGDPVINPKNWELKTLSQIAKAEDNAIRRGPFGSALLKEYFVEEGYLVYEQYHALNDDYTFRRYYVDKYKFKELEAFKAGPGDLIISCSGVYLGKISEIPADAPIGIINQALLKISLDQKKALNKYFLFIFRHPGIKYKLLGDFRGSGIPNFPPMTTVNGFKFPIPPIELQKKFVSIVLKTRVLKERYISSLSEMENQFNSLMQKAFRGEL